MNETVPVDVFYFGVCFMFGGAGGRGCLRKSG